MDFFDKIKNTLSSPLRNIPTCCPSELKTWKLSIPSFTRDHVRLLLFRDCDRRGRKCLYDSHHVIRDKNGKFSYTGCIPSTGKSEMKNISEYIFGCIPLSNNNTKRYHKFNEKSIWSQVFCPRKERIRHASNGSELTSSTSADDESIPQNMKTGGNNLSLPNIVCKNSTDIKTCLSLPSQLELQKTLLGLAIVVESNSQNHEILSSYLQSISTVLEDCTDWFSTVASKAYCTPATFVQTLYDFSQEIKSLLYSRLMTPMISTVGLPSNWKALPSTTKELINLLLRLDKCICKTNERVKLVLLGGPKKASEVSCLFYLFKILLLQCNEELGLDATTVCRNTSPKVGENPTSQKQKQKCFFAKALMQSIEIPASSPCSSSSSIQQICSNVEIRIPKFENESMQKRDYDSGIDLSFSSTSVKSMKRSSSQKFDSTCGSLSPFDSAQMFSYPSSHTCEEVSFHLGDLDQDDDQSINTLALSEPNFEKLKSRDHRSITKRKEAFIEPVQEQVEQLSAEPIQVELNFTKNLSGHSSVTKHHVNSYCQFCDSIVTHDKFSPFYYIQWVKGSDLPEESFKLMQTFTSSKFLVINLEKSLLRPVNFDIPNTKEMISSNFVSKLVDNIQSLTSESRESEIEPFLVSQLDIVKNTAHEFGTKLRVPGGSHVSTDPKDTNLIYCMAKLRCLNLE